MFLFVGGVSQKTNMKRSTIIFAQAVIIYIPIADDVKKQAGCWLSDSGCIQSL